ncbi:MAG: hypothetical protein ABR548_11945 [Actinomycetota bacterium]|nr:hypothetical protein [Actinomycetota bacterium]
MPWCHTCRVEYQFELDACPECRGGLTDAPAPERRTSSIADQALVLLATLPAEQALVAAGRLDAGGIANALRDTEAGVASMDGPVEVLVHGPQLSIARDVLRGRNRRRGRPTIALYVLLVTATALFLSGALFIARWFFTGSPVSR